MFVPPTRLALPLLLAALLATAEERFSRGEPPRFVRGGLVVPEGDDLELAESEGAEGVRTLELGDGRRLLEFDWRPGGSYAARSRGARQVLVAPLAPSPYCVRTVPLEDVSAAAASGVTPDAALRFAP